MPNNDYVKREDIFPAVTEIAKEIVFGNQDDDKVIDIINSIPAADVEPKRRWIPVTDPEIPLPEPYKRVMVFSKFMGQNTDWIGDNGDWFRTPFVTHWKPLGEPPKEEDDGE